MTPDKTVIQQGVRNHIWEILVWSGEKKVVKLCLHSSYSMQNPFILTNFSTDDPDDHKILPLAFERYQKEIVKNIVKLCLHSRILTAHKENPLTSAFYFILSKKNVFKRGCVFLSHFVYKINFFHEFFLAVIILLLTVESMRRRPSN